ncbi:PTS sugar transporter subunit IIA [Affinibrenneria salicis]|uniref:PTS sugar transporter subunit IIA n=1 Tax=Affinibrenneria salicis TaxID=2590031 RepID=A0A5J5FUN7_9GAMM|nr:PTS sugar transporter subunit IIA [Affinibrenneria salicis]KAA8996996.1 PTS sugar transporter subunit IIA [Affinibrenneria salicis]
MLNDWLMDDHIQICSRVDDWREAVRLSAQPLLHKKIISAGYVAAILQQCQTLGPYFVLAPGIAMPHARPEEGAGALGLSLLKIDQGVAFHSRDNDPVFIVVMLAAPDSHSHIELIAQLAELFSSNEAMSSLFQAKTKQQIKDIINRHSLSFGQSASE